MKNIFRGLSLLLYMWVVSLALPVCAQDATAPYSILLITSYNPDTRSISQNIDAFMNVYNERGSSARIIVESLNCQNLESAHDWKVRMSNILDKYKEGKGVDIVIILGQEAWASFLSQDDPRVHDIPVMPILISRNVIKIPDDTVDIAEYQPESLDLRMDLFDFNIVGGYAYEYRMPENIELANRYFPQADTLVFVTDNTFGGLNMQAWMRDAMRKYPEVPVKWIDGRKQSFNDVHNILQKMSPGNVIFCGTWRMDRTNDIALGSTTSSLYRARPDIPVITLSSVGLGNWAVCGYVPKYNVWGDEVARDCLDYLENPYNSAHPVTIIPDEYVFDYARMKEFKLDMKSIPEDAKVINKPITVFDRYPLQMVLGILLLIGLLVGLVLSILHLVKYRREKDEALAELSRCQADVGKASADKVMFHSILRRCSDDLLEALPPMENEIAKVMESPDQTAADSGRNLRNMMGNVSRLVGDVDIIEKLSLGVELKRSTVSINDICRESISKIDYLLSPDTVFRFVPASGSPEVTVSPYLLDIMLRNLLYNAFMFTSAGQVTLQVVVDPDTSLVTITVSDTGDGWPGLGPDEWPTDRRGIGLSLMRGLVRLTGADLSISHNYTKGARIIYTFSGE